MSDIKEIHILDVADRLGLEPRPKTRTEYVARCPICGDSSNERHKHLYLNIVEDKYYCTRCGVGGYAIGLYAKATGIDTKEAYRELINDAPVSHTVVKPPVVNVPELADIETRNKAYNALLKKLELYINHTADLKRRGLTVKEIISRGYRSVPQDPALRQSICRELIKASCALKGVPGFYTGGNGNWDFYGVPGYLIPVRDTEGRIQGMQVRLDNPGDGGKYRWFSMPDKENSTPAKTWIHTSHGIDDEVWITEGPLKADVASFLTGHTFIGVAGVNATKGLTEQLKEIGVKEVVIAFDMDFVRNENVEEAIKHLHTDLKKAGVKTATACWHPGMGKGIDDAILSGANIEITGRKVSLLKRIFGAK
jgi:hypothetical protein